MHLFERSLWLICPLMTLLFLYMIGFIFPTLWIDIDLWTLLFFHLLSVWQEWQSYLCRIYMPKDVLSWLMNMHLASAHQSLVMTCWHHLILRGRLVWQVNPNKETSWFIFLLSISLIMWSLFLKNFKLEVYLNKKLMLKSELLQITFSSFNMLICWNLSNLYNRR